MHNSIFFQIQKSSFLRVINYFICCLFLFGCGSQSSENKTVIDNTLTDVVFKSLEENLISNYTVVTVNWTPPKYNVDGTILTNLVGYKLYYGESIDEMINEIVIFNSENTAYTIKNLNSGKIYFLSITAFNSYGSESRKTDPLKFSL